MSNKSYLCATDFNPLRPISAKDKQNIEVICCSVCDYDIPIVFKVLTSANPQACYSLIFDEESQIAIIGNYHGGLKKLNEFFKDLLQKQLFDNNALESKIRAANLYFESCPNKEYFLLECAEIYCMGDNEWDMQNQSLVNSLKDIDVEIEEFYRAVKLNPDNRDWLFSEIGLDDIWGSFDFR